MYLTPILSAVLVLLVFAKPAQAENMSQLKFDAIYQLPFVHSLTFGPEGNDLFVAFKGHLLQWSLHPLQLKHHQPTAVLAKEAVFGPKEQLYLIGLDWRGFSSLALQPSDNSSDDEGGSSKVENIFRTDAGSMALSYHKSTEPGAGLKLFGGVVEQGVSQFSSIAFDTTGMPFLTSVNDFRAYRFLTVNDAPAGKIEQFPALAFSCGGASQLSIFTIAGTEYYLASIAGRAVLEFNKLSLGSLPSEASECFEVGRSRKKEQTPSMGKAVRHAVIDLGDGPFAKDSTGKGVLVLDPNTNTLSVYRIEEFNKQQFISRRGVIEVDLSEFLRKGDRGAFLTDLALDKLGREIQVSSNKLETVLRFQFDGKELTSRGRISTGAPVRKIVISPDGANSAIVTGTEAFGGDWRIVLISNPSLQTKWLQFPLSFPSITRLQKALSKANYSAGIADGILGPQTVSAVEIFWKKNASQKPTEGDKALKASILTIFPGFLLDGKTNMTAN